MLKMLATLAAASTIALVSPAFAEKKERVAKAPNNWGQEVKKCNQTDCYPGGTSRGKYVREQARDDEGPGYAYEIHRFANPGKSNPKGDKFDRD